jgi:hypothetical protein
MPSFILILLHKNSASRQQEIPGEHYVVNSEFAAPVEYEGKG